MRLMIVAAIVASATFLGVSKSGESAPIPTEGALIRVEVEDSIVEVVPNPTGNSMLLRQRTRADSSSIGFTDVTAMTAGDYRWVVAGRAADIDGVDVTLDRVGRVPIQAGTGVWLAVLPQLEEDGWVNVSWTDQRGKSRRMHLRVLARAPEI
jgi:hypothetical protein